MVNNTEKIHKRNTNICNTAKNVVDEAKNLDITSRLYGGCAVWLNNYEFKNLLSQKGRVLKDIDLFSYSTEKERLKNLLIKIGYEPAVQSPVSSFYMNVFYKNDLKLEVVYDSLRYCHDIEINKYDFRDQYTLNLSDLLLSKLQIVQLSETDIYDLWVLLFRLFKMEKQEQKKEIQSLISVLSINWEFYYTVKMNINKLMDKKSSEIFIIKYAEMNYFLKNLENEIEQCTKSLAWKLRSIVGTKLKWYKEIN